MTADQSIGSHLGANNNRGKPKKDFCKIKKVHSIGKVPKLEKFLLELHGLKTEKREQLDTVRVCDRCQAKNSPVARFCAKCGLALDLKAALEVDTRVARAEELLETLLTKSEVKSYLVEKIRELGLTRESS